MHSKWSHNMNEESSYLSDRPVRTLGPLFLGLVVLLSMKRHLGLEAMVEYMERYVRIMREANPRAHDELTQALSLLRVKEIHAELMDG